MSPSCIIIESRTAFDAQCFASAGHEEYQGDFGIVENVLQRKSKLVAFALGYKQSVIVGNTHEARCIAFGRDLRPAILAAGG